MHSYVLCVTSTQIKVWKHFHHPRELPFLALLSASPTQRQPLLWLCHRKIVFCLWPSHKRNHIVLLHVFEFLKTELLSRITIWSRNSISEYRPKEIESKASNRYLYTHVHCSSIHNSQQNTKWPFMDEWISKMWYIPIVLSAKIRKNTSYIMDDTWGYCSKWNRSVTKGTILCESGYMRYLGVLKLIAQKIEWWVARNHGEREV